MKYGFGVNFEQPLTDWLGVFGRWGWNEGQHESYAYTEVDQTWQIGWREWRALGPPRDRMGLVFVCNGINHEHARIWAMADWVFSGRRQAELRAGKHS